MKQINDQQLIDAYFSEVKLQECFSNNVRPIVKLYSFSKGENIIERGKIPENLYFLVNGQVWYITFTEKGDPVSLGGTENFSVFGEAASLWKMEPSNNVTARTDCLCLGICLSKYRDLLLNDNTFLRFICRTLASRLVRQNDTAISYISTNDSQKLAAFILQNAKDNALTLSLKDCAEALGISYRHLIRLMNSLVERGCMRKEKKKYYIQDYRMLYHLSSETFEYYD